MIVAVIGNGWVGRRLWRQARIRDAGDRVRKGLEHALASGKPVIPVLVGAASLPRARGLPPSLRGLLAVHAASVRDETFAHDTERLAEAIRAIVGARQDDAPHAFLWRQVDGVPAIDDRRWLFGGAMVAAAAVAVAVALVLRSKASSGVDLTRPATWTAPPEAASRGPVPHLALQLALLELQASTKESQGDNGGYNVAKFTERFGSTLRLPWTAAFVGWCYLEATRRRVNAPPVSLRFTDSASSRVLADSLREHGWLVEPFDARRARPGDIVFLRAQGRIAHMEIVYALEDGKVCSIGGNVDNRVSGRCRAIDGDAVAALPPLPPEAFSQGE